MLALPPYLLAQYRQFCQDQLYHLAYQHGRPEQHKQAAVPEAVPGLTGTLYGSRSGWLLLTVPNAVARGLFDALHEQGVELPRNRDGKLNAHISVMNPGELARIGGLDKISERGHSFRYNLGAIKTVRPTTWNGVSRVWYVSITSPELQALRRSYGLSSLPNENKHEFHCTFAIRKRKVLHSNDVCKSC